MNSRVHDAGKKFGFGQGNQDLFYRHLYDRYGTGIADDSISRDNFNCNEIKSKSKIRDVSVDRQNGFEDRNAAVMRQTFVTENPFFRAYYPAIRPRSAEEVSARENGRSLSRSSIFDDSKTYKIIYSGDSACNEDDDSSPDGKLKKNDDIHHIHEHHHFFHDKNNKKPNSNCYGKTNDQKHIPFHDSKINFLKKQIEESCMVYMSQEDRAQIGKERSKEASRHVSRSNSSKRSSDNETYTIVCDHCQKLLKEYPSARIIGHEMVPNITSRVSTPRTSKYEPIQKNMLPENVFFSYLQHQDKVPERDSRQKKMAPFYERDIKKKRTKDDSKMKIPIPGMNSKASDSKSKMFQCDHCKSIIEMFTFVEEINEKTEDLDETRKIQKKKTRIKPEGKELPKRSSQLSEKRNSDRKTIEKKNGNVINSADMLSRCSTLFDKKKSSGQEVPRPSSVVDGKRNSRSSSCNGSREKESVDKRRSSSYKEKRVASEISKQEKSHSDKNADLKEGKILKKTSNQKESVKKPSSAHRESQKSVTSKTVIRKESKEPSSRRRVSSNIEKDGSRVKEDRSMQTTFGKLSTVPEIAEPKQKKTASKILPRKGEKEEKRRLDAPLGSKEKLPVHQKLNTKGAPNLDGIQSEITDLKTQLERLEAMHNLKGDVNESNSNATHEISDCPKHPIVVCTSTTYIMTKCSDEWGSKSPLLSPRELGLKPPKKRDSNTEPVSAEDCSRRNCPSNMNALRKVFPGPEDKPSSKIEYSSLKSGLVKPNCQFVGARITKAINKVCQCSNKDILSRLCDGEGRTKSIDREDAYRRLFGKNQACAIALTSGVLLRSLKSCHEKDCPIECCRDKGRA